jgi:hypothetical protein
MAHEISSQSGKTGRPGDPVIVNGNPLTDKRNQEHQQQETTPSSQEQATRGLGELEQQDEVQLQAEALALKLTQTYEELTRLLEQNPAVKRQITESEAEEDKVYQKLKQGFSPQPAQNRRGPGTPELKLADAAPRCRWVRQDGTSCGSPRMKKHIYCFAHRQMMEAQALALSLPAPEDANAIQIGLMRIQKALIDDTISTKKAGLLLYSLQLALQNVGQTTFGQARTEDLVQETVDEEEALSGQRSAVSEGALSQEALSGQHSPVRQGQTFETQRNGGSRGGEDLPRMDADPRGLKMGIRPVEWRPTPDMYRTDTPEGRAAYEASLSDENRAATRVPARATRPVIAPDDRAETHAIPG